MAKKTVVSKFSGSRFSWKLYLVLVLPVLALSHFLYFALFNPTPRLNLDYWELQSCRFKENRKFVDLNCRHFLASATSLAQPYLGYGEKLECVKQSSLALQKFPVGHPALGAASIPCESARWWSERHSTRDIGWDAYAVWYARAAEIYFQSQKPGWPGVRTALLDPTFRQVWPNIEHAHYPWLLPLMYSGLMKLVASPSPIALQVFQFLLFLCSVGLFYLTWRKAPKYLFVAFAFVPIAGNLLFHLYADLWLICFLLGLSWALQKSHWLLGAVLSLLLIHLKAEAWVQWLALMATFAILYRRRFHSDKKFSKGLLCVFLVGFASFIFYWRQFGIFESSEFYVPMAKRLLTLQTYTQIIPRILGYYLDVLFRPTLWGILWPATFYFLYKSRKSLRWALAPLALVLLLIPLSFLKFPNGFKEVVLTGSNRALWQTLPMLWLLLKNLKFETKEPVSRKLRRFS